MIPKNTGDIPELQEAYTQAAMNCLEPERVGGLRILADPRCSRHLNPKTGAKAPIPRHTEIRNTLCALIKSQLRLAEDRGVE